LDKDWERDQRFKALVKFFIESPDTIKLVKVPEFPKAGKLYPRKKCKYRWNRDLHVQAAIHGLMPSEFGDKVFRVTDATDPNVKPWLIIKYLKEAAEKAGAEKFFWYCD